MAHGDARMGRPAFAEAKPLRLRAGRRLAGGMQAMRRRAFIAGAGASFVVVRAWGQQRTIRLALVATGFPIDRMNESGDAR